MVFHANYDKNPGVLEVWLPDLSAPPFPHEVGIVTGLDSKKLDLGNSYSLSGPTASKPGEPASNDPAEIYCPKVSGKDSEIYNLKNFLSSSNVKPTTKCIYMSLPIPRQIVGLTPVLCQIEYDGKSNGKCMHRATGVRLLYGTANKPTLNGTDLPIDVGSQDQQVEISIIHHPIKHDECLDHPEARSDWGKMGEMLGIKNLGIKFDCGDANLAKTEAGHGMKLYVGAVNDCVSPLGMF